MTDIEELIQEANEPATVANTIVLLDKCTEDLVRLMEARAIIPCIHAKNLVYGLEQSREMLRQVYQDMDAILNPKTDTQNAN